MNKQLKAKVYSVYSDTMFKFYKELGWFFDPITGTFYIDEFKVSCRPDAEYYDHLVFRPYLSVKNKTITGVLNQIFPDSPIYNVVGRGQSKELANIMGIQWESKYVDENDNYRYDIYEDTDLAPIVADHRLYMERVGVPFFDSFSSLEKVDTFINLKILKMTFKEFRENINEPIEEKKWLNFYNVTGANYGLVSAFLTKNLNKMELVKRYTLLYSVYPVIEDFEKLIVYLETNYLREI